MQLNGLPDHSLDAGPENRFRHYLYYAYTRIHFAYYFVAILVLSVPLFIKIAAIPIPFIFESRWKQKSIFASLSINFLFVIYTLFFYWSFTILLQAVILGELFFILIICLGAAFQLTQIFGLHRVKILLTAVAFVHLPIIALIRPSFLTFAVALPILVAFFVAGLHSPTVLRRTNGAYLGLSFSIIIISFTVTSFYLFLDLSEYDEVVNQEGITGVFRLDQYDPVGKYFSKTHIRNISEDCSGRRLFLPGHTSALCGNDYFYIYDRKHGIVNSSLSILPDDGLDIDCASDRLFLSSGKNIIVLDITNNRNTVIGNYPTSTNLFVQIFYHPGFDMLYLMSDEREFLIVDPKTGEETFFLPDAGRRLAVSGSNVFIYTGETISVWSLNDTGRAISFEQKRELPISSTKGHLVADPVDSALYLNDFSGGTVYKLDRNNLEIIGITSLQPGLRHLAISPNGRLLLSVNFARGDLYLINPGNMQLLEKLTVGIRARDVKFSHDGKLAYIPSSAGGFSIDLPYFERKYSLSGQNSPDKK